MRFVFPALVKNACPQIALITTSLICGPFVCLREAALYALAQPPAMR
jgi:hypothetical protein